jgi:hypothetical protein
LAAIYLTVIIDRHYVWALGDCCLTKRDSLPKDLRKKLDRLKIPTLKELNDTLKRLTPEQLKFLENQIQTRM